MSEYMYVMDYSVNTITEIELSPEDEGADWNDLLSKYGFKDSNCSWMFTTDRIDDIIRIS